MKKTLPLIVLVVLAAVVFVLKQCNAYKHLPSTIHTKTITKKSTAAQSDNYSQRGLNRNPSHINYSKHARCRMDCRHIDETEVTQILRDGNINYKKSELEGDDCNKKYAVEGETKDNQEVRIIFAPCTDEVTVVTVIDLGKEWVCDCN